MWAIFSLKYISLNYFQYFLNLYISLCICVSRVIDNNAQIYGFVNINKIEFLSHTDYSKLI